MKTMKENSVKENPVINRIFNNMVSIIFSVVDEKLGKTR